jgi:beta-glucosidase
MKPVPKYLQSRLPIKVRVEDLLKRMTVEEKIAQLWSMLKDDIVDSPEKSPGVFNPEKAKAVFKHGMGHINAPFQEFSSANSVAIANPLHAFVKENTRLGIPVLINGEALHGVIGKGCTSYPQAIALGATWNPELVERVAVAIGREARARGMHQVLSPVLDIARDARVGRVEETYGEDPFLVSRLGVAFVKGVQSQRVVTTPKHFAANFVGDGGRDSHAIHISERLLREVYLPPYEAVVTEAGALSIMSAYHSLDGMPCTANHWLLTDLLRGEWGFKGLVVSDWGATEQINIYHYVAKDFADAAQKALCAGMDMEAPFSRCFKHLPELVRKGKVSRKVLDTAVRRALYLKFWAGLFEQGPLDPAEATRITNCPAHQQLALDSARQVMVLLKNNGVLPLEPTVKTLAVIGPNAATGLLGGYSNWDTTIVSPLDGLKKMVSPQTRVLHTPGCAVNDQKREGFAEAIRIAREADAVVMVMGNTGETEGEQRDRSDLDLPGVQEDLILEVAKANPRLAVVLIGGSAVTMTRWIDQVPAIVVAWYPGQAGGTALAEVLYGAVNPGGKLPISFPKVTGQCPFYYNAKPSGRVLDYCDLRGAQAQFPFGHGLSYTKFKYQKLHVRKSGAGTKLRYDISAEITNIGQRAGDEVVQLYLHDEFSERSRPLQELKAFQRVSLKPGQSTTVRFRLTWRDVAYLGDDLKPTLEPGNLEFMLGSSCQDIRLRYGSAFKEAVEAEAYECSPLQPVAPDIGKASFPAPTLSYAPVTVSGSGTMRYTDARAHYHNQDGLIYLRTRLTMMEAGKGQLLFGADGPVRIWVNNQPVACVPIATNPILRDQYQATVNWQEGVNEVVFALNTNHGKVFGVAARGVQI